ncbi:hypothetical protein Q3G72_021669 [Acer saccharum]|nr:hypothetical protein Q3G72_021669 [Acer saccharum]
MREKASERRSRFMAKEVNRDFRDGLFSVFVDNLNHSVDQRSLWNIFKPFGRIRDVFLSFGLKRRGSNYAFIWFATLEEAERMVRQSNGMHVYEWLIVLKMASSSWDNRQRKGWNGAGRSWGNVNRRGGSRANSISTPKRSFADVLGGRVSRKDGNGKKVHEVHKGVEEVKEVFWARSKDDQGWLSKGIVGSLKRFDKVSRVNQALASKGIVFKSSYLGDKSILWRFGNE